MTSRSSGEECKLYNDMHGEGLKIIQISQMDDTLHASLVKFARLGTQKTNKFAYQKTNSIKQYYQKGIFSVTET